MSLLVQVLGLLLWQLLAIDTIIIMNMLLPFLNPPADANSPQAMQEIEENLLLEDEGEKEVRPDLPCASSPQQCWI